MSSIPSSRTPATGQPGSAPGPGRRRWLGRALSSALAAGIALAFGPLAPAGPALAPADAHGPTPQRIDESISIAAPPAKVWALVSEFGDFAAWNPWLSASKADKGNTVGSVRTLTRAEGGGQLTEDLDDLNAGEMSLSYRSGRTIDPAVMPASSYSARIRVSAEGSGSKVEFRARAYRADTGNDPGKGKDDKAVVQAMKAYIGPALEALRAKAEKP